MSQHPLIYTYLKKFQDNPTSKVFAPLAEAYRKAGLLDEALEVVREGLRVHPRFVGGRVALARILFDKRHYDQVLQELSLVVEESPDNLIAQKLLAESHLMLGHYPQALQAYKMYLYFAPQDSDTARMVQELEAQSYENGERVVKEDFSFTAFEEQPVGELSAHDLERRKQSRIRRIELLQSFLQRIERYRLRSSR